MATAVIHPPSSQLLEGCSSTPATPPSAQSAEISSIRSECRSIQALLDEIARRQSLLLSRLDSLQPGATSHMEDKVPTPLSCPVSPLGPKNSWVTVRSGKPRKCSSPSSSETEDGTITLYNYFAPLQLLMDAELAQRNDHPSLLPHGQRLNPSTWLCRTCRRCFGQENVLLLPLTAYM
ncbi:unnamed protein product [Gadus morhua 'NCC']